MAITADNIADISLRPVALLAKRLRWPGIISADMNGPVEVPANSVVKLLDSVHLGFEVGGRAWSNMTGHAFHVGVGRVFGGYELRFHGKMAGLSTKLDRLRNVIGLVAPQSSDE